MLCQKCGFENASEARFCVKCGNMLGASESIADPAPQSEPQSSAPSWQPTQVPPQESYPPPPHQGYPPPPAAPYQPEQTPPQGYYPGYPPPPPPSYNQPGFVSDAYSKAFGFLFKKPILLWGLSLLCVLMVCLTVFFSILPIIWVPIVAVFTLGMYNIFLCGYRGMDISSTQLFESFAKGKFVRNAGGMLWMELWVLIWLLVPIAGPVLAIIKAYSYRFVPYILITDPDISATEALKKSIIQTEGYRGRMFLVDLLVFAALVIFALLLYVLSMIPFIGIIIALICYVVVLLFLPLLVGILNAVVYDKVSKEKAL